MSEERGKRKTDVLIKREDSKKIKAEPCEAKEPVLLEDILNRDALKKIMEYATHFDSTSIKTVWKYGYTCKFLYAVMSEIVLHIPRFNIGLLEVEPNVNSHSEYRFFPTRVGYFPRFFNLKHLLCFKVVKMPFFRRDWIRRESLCCVPTLRATPNHLTVNLPQDLWSSEYDSLTLHRKKELEMNSYISVILKETRILLTEITSIIDSSKLSKVTVIGLAKHKSLFRFKFMGNLINLFGKAFKTITNLEIDFLDIEQMRNIKFQYFPLLKNLKVSKLVVFDRDGIAEFVVMLDKRKLEILSLKKIYIVARYPKGSSKIPDFGVQDGKYTIENLKEINHEMETKLPGLAANAYPRYMALKPKYVQPVINIETTQLKFRERFFGEDEEEFKRLESLILEEMLHSFTFFAVEKISVLNKKR